MKESHIFLTHFFPDPCESTTCYPNSHCVIANGRVQCQCNPGFSLKEGNRICGDINECVGNPCGKGAICENTIGSFFCQCPKGQTGDPFIKCMGESPNECSNESDCGVGEVCLSSYCICRRGYAQSDTGECLDVDECLLGNPCGINAVCRNLPGSYNCECPPTYQGNPYTSCQQCVDRKCDCQPPYFERNGECHLPDCQNCNTPAKCIEITGGINYCACPIGFKMNGNTNQCEDVDECQAFPSSPCGGLAVCLNTLGSYICSCPAEYVGDPYQGTCSPLRSECKTSSECRQNEECVDESCVCSPPFFVDTSNGNLCRSPCHRFSCGYNAECTPSNPPQCLCKAGFTGNPLSGCEDLDECIFNPCKQGSICLNKQGTYECECPRGSIGDPYVTGCSGLKSTECQHDDNCSGQLACIEGQCKNPCSSVPCGTNAHCVAENHAAWCRCKSGFSEDSKGQCISLCDGITCGHNAQCIVSFSGPTCQCLKGMTGNAFPGGECSPTDCSSSVTCMEPDQTCHAGKCRTQCGNRLCGMGAICDLSRRTCTCKSGFVGDPNLVCVPPSQPAVCSPSCGNNAHCLYNDPNRCQCNDGYYGNPYLGCSQDESNDCDALKCGQNAICTFVSGEPQCNCRRGFDGAPYQACYDVDECLFSVCGDNTQCINTPGGYDCLCRNGFVGNPFEACLPTMSINASKSEVPDYLCDQQKCGPNAICSLGQCLCTIGFKGEDPYNTSEGCSSMANCQTNSDCGYNEICSTIAHSGQKFCSDPCQEANCGPNSLCVTDNHQKNCICQLGFNGDASDLLIGCQREEVCSSNEDCPGGHTCHINLNGDKTCLDPCKIMSCPINEVCQIEHGFPVCRCKSGYHKNKLTESCAFLQTCQSDEDCALGKICHEMVLGTKSCVPACDLVECPQEAKCVVQDHQAFCRCNNGYHGNPDDRKGCVPINSKACSSNFECSESEVCKEFQGASSCHSACQFLQCGDGAVCVVKNHVGKCVCPPGLYKGDPNTEGCRKVNCVENDDCKVNEVCDRLSYTCTNPCEGSKNICGENALCSVSNHQTQCQCIPSYIPAPTPFIKCEKNDLDKQCPYDQCRTTCSSDKHCPPSHFCNSGVCVTGCSSSQDCEYGKICTSGRCQDPCSSTCGPNALCTPSEDPVCRCPKGFAGVPTPIQGCVRIPSSCPPECSNTSRCFNGYCMLECTTHGDCARGEQCSQGICLKLCHTDKNCLQGEICRNKFCEPGCRMDSDCRLGELCTDGNCQCQPGYIKSQDGCSDINECQDKSVCPSSHVCANTPGSFICSCPTNQVSDGNGNCRLPNQCVTDSDCDQFLACAVDEITGVKKCLDPCDISFCTDLATCSVKSHKPFCSCPPRHRGDPSNPNIGCYEVECEETSDCPKDLTCDTRTFKCHGILTTCYSPDLNDENITNFAFPFQIPVKASFVVTVHAELKATFLNVTVKMVTLRWVHPVWILMSAPNRTHVIPALFVPIWKGLLYATVLLAW